MRVPLSWLRDFVDITIPVQELAERLTFGGLEVESIEYIGVPSPGKRGGKGDNLVWGRDKILVGRLVEVKPHPNADRLTLAVVDYGGAEPIQVVTGAPNIRVGDKGHKVVLALEGAQLYDGHKPGRELMTLKRSKIRGIESGSMVCSEKELGLSDEHEGIIILPDDAPVGTPLADYMGDVVLDLKINPNMARAQSILGVAREVAALTGQSVKVARREGVPHSTPETDFARIEIANPALCARYSAVMIRGVDIKASPHWMQRRLELAGMRPINNIVDITNYVMIEQGQPLHAFDHDKLVARASGDKPTIIIRPARAGERIETLDGVVRRVKPTDLLITDPAGPIAIAGVMGGAETEVSPDTKNVLLEAANFDYISIRRTTQEQKLPSEAATRFGRGIHPSQTVPGALRAAELMHSLASGQVDTEIADAYPAPVVEPTIDLTTDEVERILGIRLSEDQITRILRALDFQVESRGHEVISATPPDYRLDVDGSDDLIEELARIYGYDRIPSTLIGDSLPPQHENTPLELEERARNLLVDGELQEIVTYAMTHPGLEARVTLITSPAEGGRTEVGEYDPRPQRPYVEIENPISTERSVMRQSLLPSDLEILASNLRFTDRAAFFEIGKVYLKRPDDNGESGDGAPDEAGALLPLEKTRLAIVMTGPRGEPNWQNADTAPRDFFDLKGVIQEFARGLHLLAVSYAASHNPMFHPGRAAVMRVGDTEVGVFGELHPVVRERFGLPAQAVLVGEFELESMFEHTDPKFRVKPLSRYPAVVQDIAMIVDETVPEGDVEELIRQAGGALLSQAWLFDVYHGDPLPPGRKSLAYRLAFQAPDRGLTDADAAKIRERVVQRLKRELGAELRGGETHT